MSALLSALAMLLCAALLAVLLRGQQRPEMAMCLSLAAGVVVLLLLLRQVTPLLDTLRQMLTAGSFPAPYLTVVVKATGVCLLTQARPPWPERRSLPGALCCWRWRCRCLPMCWSWLRR